MDIIENLTNDWQNSGILENDIVLIHSDIRRTLFNYSKKNVIISPGIILESFIKSVGENGTLIFPTFNFNFSTHKTPFSIIDTPSEMGVLTEYARKNVHFIRTKHPVYSFAVYGKHKKIFEAADNKSAYSDDSPFGILKYLNGKIASLNLDELSSMTFYHHIEEINRVNYRYFKNFSGDYIDEFGIKSNKTFSIFVRDIQRGVKTHLNPVGELLWSEKLYSGYRHNEGTGLRVINAQKMFDFVTKEIINKNKAEGLLYRIEK